MQSKSLHDPYDPHTSLDHAHSHGEPTPLETHSTLQTPEKIIDRVVENTVVRAIFGGNDVNRRRFMQLVGASSAAALIESLFPLKMAKALAQEQVGNIEKKDLTIGFIPITCATPIIMAEPMGFYKKHGLNAKVRRASGWAMVRDWSINKDVDAAHMLSPMPLSITLGCRVETGPVFHAGR